MKAQSFRTKIQSEQKLGIRKLNCTSDIQSLLPLSLFLEYFNGQPLSLEGRNLPVTTHELAACLK